MLTAAPAAQPAARTFTVTRRPADGPDGLPCWLALPEKISDRLPPIVAVHGIRREADAQANLFAERAAALGRPVIAPIFEKDRWPRYQQAVRRGRADLALLSLMDALRHEQVWHTRTFDLFGFSGGAQFAHRFAMLHPETVSRLTTASAGWYTFPDDAAFPYGLSPRPGRTDTWAPGLTANLDQFLKIPIQVCVGADDSTRDRNTRSGPEIDAQQGTHRMARAARWARALQDAALARGIAPRVTFWALSACGHDFRVCVTRGRLDRIVVPEERPSDETGTSAMRGVVQHLPVCKGEGATGVTSGRPSPGQTS